MLNDNELTSVADVRAFLEGSKKVTFTAIDSRERVYEWLQGTLVRLNYYQLSKVDKGVVRIYLLRVTGYSRAQLTRLVTQYKQQGKIKLKTYKRKYIAKKYGKKEIRLLAEVDKIHHILNGSATKKIFERAFTVYGQKEYELLSNISVSHIYNLRRSKTYLSQITTYKKTQYTSVQYGTRKKPEPNGMPGFIRIDSVHQGDQDGVKGVYHINAVDEVTQFEIVCSVEKITEAYLIPVIELILDQFPFELKGFHADNGSEYVNQFVAELLNKLLIEFTKSRPRHSNDNALAESKNGSVVRKYLGYSHIPQKFAFLINEFNLKYLNPYLNYHRPCYFSRNIVDKKGKSKKVYKYEDINTPYEKLKSLSNAESYLKENITFALLDKIAKKMTDNEAGKIMSRERNKLFEIIRKETIMQ